MRTNDGVSRDADLTDDDLTDALTDAELTGVIGIIDFVVFSFRAVTSCTEI